MDRAHQIRPVDGGARAGVAFLRIPSAGTMSTAAKAQKAPYPMLTSVTSCKSSTISRLALSGGRADVRGPPKLRACPIAACSAASEQGTPRGRLSLSKGSKQTKPRQLVDQSGTGASATDGGSGTAVTGGCCRRRQTRVWGRRRLECSIVACHAGGLLSAAWWSSQILLGCMVPGCGLLRAWRCPAGCTSRQSLEIREASAVVAVQVKLQVATNATYI